MNYDPEMVAQGTTLSRAKLTHQARVFSGLAKSYARDLAVVDWKPSNTDELDQLIGTLETAVMAQTSAKEQARITAQTVREAVATARAFLKKVRTALPTALRSLPKGDTTRAMFKVQAPLGSSQARLGAYLTQIRPAIEKLQPKLAPLFKGTQPLAALDAAKAKLDAAAAPHGVARLRLPESTMAVNEAKGRLLVKLRELVQYAKIAFDDRPNVVSQFSLDSRISGRPNGSKIDPATPTTEHSSNNDTASANGIIPPQKDGTNSPPSSPTSTNKNDTPPAKPAEKPADKQVPDKPATALVTTGRTEPVGPVPQ